MFKSRSSRDRRRAVLLLATSESPRSATPQSARRAGSVRTSRQQPDGIAREYELAEVERGYRGRFLATVIMIVCLLPLIGYAAHMTSNSMLTLPSRWLPESMPERQSLTGFIDDFESGDFIVVSWEGCTVDDPRLEAVQAAFDAIASNWSRAADAALLDRTTTSYAVLREMTEGPLQLPRDEALERLSESLVGSDGLSGCAVVALTEKGVFARVQSSSLVVDEVSRATGLAAEELILAGPPVEGGTLDTEASFAANVLSIPSTIISALLCLWCLRSHAYTAVVLTTAVFGEVLVLAGMYAFGVRMSAVLIILPPLVLVLTVSAGVHLVNYYFDESRRHGSSGAASRALASGWRPCAMAALTTTFGLGSLVVSDIEPIYWFGVLSVIGIVATIGVLFLVLPGVMVARPFPRSKLLGAKASRGQDEQTTRPAPSDVEFMDDADRLDRFWDRVAEWVARYSGRVTVAFLLITAVTAYGLLNIEASMSFDSLFLPESRIARDYRLLEQQLGPLVPAEVILHFDTDNELPFLDRLDVVRRVEREISEVGDIAGVLSAATFAPEELPQPGTDNPDNANAIAATQHQPPVQRVAARIPASNDPKLLQQFEEERRRQEQLMREKYEEELRLRREQELQRIQADLEQKNYLADSESRQSWRVSGRVSALAGIDYAGVLDRLEHRVDPVLEELNGDGEPTIHAEYTGIMPVVSRAQRILLEDLFKSFLTAFGLVAIAMMFLLRSVRAGLFAMLPNVYPTVVVFGLMGWLQIPVDIGAMMTASVALGIAVDDTLHFLTWYRIESGNGHTPAEAVRLCFRHCARAMTQTTLICGLGMLVFSISGCVPTQRFAWLMLALLTTTLIGDLVFLPAMLMGTAGKAMSYRSNPAADALRRGVDSLGRRITQAGAGAGLYEAAESSTFQPYSSELLESAGTTSTVQHDR